MAGKRMIAKYAGTCRACGGPFPMGAEIVYGPSGSCHGACANADAPASTGTRAKLIASKANLRGAAVAALEGRGAPQAERVTLSAQLVDALERVIGDIERDGGGRVKVSQETRDLITKCKARLAQLGALPSSQDKGG